ncbi:MAG: DUF4126 domain-containing protein [Burkholderiales bacterium]
MPFSQPNRSLRVCRAGDGPPLRGSLSAGLLDRFGVLQLPGSLEVLSHPWVLATAGFTFVAEFIHGN